MALIIIDLIAKSQLIANPLLQISIWAIALGGLGAIASIFLLILKLIPQETLRSNDELEVVGRIFLGCLFSLVLCLTIIPNELYNFFRSFNTFGNGSVSQSSGGSGAKLLLPFLCGYSIPLVLGLLGKIIRAVELTIGLEDRRESSQVKIGRKR